MASSGGYEGGGIGGKFRKRPFRRGAAATPYDRPPDAVRGLRAAATAAAAGGGGSGWMSKLVDPASRLITGGATRLFSFLGKRLLSVPALPAAPPAGASEVPMEATLQYNEQALDVGENLHLPNVSSEAPEEHGDILGENPLNKLETVGISEVEQLVKQRTFTRDEFEHLTELIRTRTVGPSSLPPLANNFVKDMHNPNISFEDGKGNSFLTPTKISLPIPVEDTPSPTEIAKAYMGSRPSKVPPSGLIPHSQVLQEETTRNFPYARNKPFSRTPLTHIYGPSGSSENGHLTSRTRGRSAMYKMSCSPYFKAQHSPSGKIGLPSRDGYARTPALQWTPRIVAESDGKQSLKRRSSVLDNEIGFGPIRRIRQKSNIVYPIKDKNHSLSESLATTSTASVEDGIHCSKSSIRTSLSTDSHMDSHKEDNASDSAAFSVPSQSTETGRKILQLLDEVVPSPEERKSELKCTGRNKSPKSTRDSLHERALKSLKDLDSPTFLNVGSSGNDETHAGSVVQNALANPDKLEDNRNSMVPISGINITSKHDIPPNPLTSGYASKSVGRAGPLGISSSDDSSFWKNPAFRISALEDSFDMDDDDDIVKDVSGPSYATKGKTGSGMFHGNSVLDTISEKSELRISSRTQPSSPSMPKTGTEPLDSSLDDKSDFAFCSASNHFKCLSPPTPTLAKQSQAPVFCFGSKGDSIVKFSSIPTSVSKLPGVEISASNSCSRVLEGSAAGDNVSKTPNTVDVTLGTDGSSGKTATILAPIFSSMTSSAPNFNNGSPSAQASASSASVGPSTESSDMKTSLIFLPGNVATTASTLSTMPSSAPTFSNSTFQIEKGPSSVVTMPVLASVKEPESKNLQESPFLWKSSFTDSSNKILPTAAKTDADSHPGSTSSFTLTSIGGASSGMATSYLSSGSDNASGHSNIPLSSTTANGSWSSMSSMFSRSVSATSSMAKPSMFTGNASGTCSLFSSAVTSPALASPSFSRSASGSNIFDTSVQNNSAHKHVRFSNMSSGPTALVFGSQPSAGSGAPSFLESSAQSGSSSSAAFGLSGSTPAFCSSSFVSTTGTETSSSSHTCPLSSITRSESSTSSTSGLASDAAMFGSSLQASALSTFGSSAQAVGFGFLSSSAGSSVPFGSSSLSSCSVPFGSTPVSTSSLPFGATFSFSTGSQGNDQMNVEDSMADDTTQALTPSVPAFAQPVNPTVMSNYAFNSPAQEPFQFGHHNSPMPQSTPSSQAGASLDFPGGSFSLGSGGGDKSGRKIIRVKRNRKK